MEIGRSEAGDAAAWDRLVREVPGASPGQDRRWPALFAEAFGHRDHSLAARERGELRGVLPLVEIRNLLVGRLLVSLPWLDAAGVCARDEAARDALVSAAAELARRRGARLEIRALARYPGVSRVLEEKVTMRLPLGAGERTLWEGFDAKLRNQVRKSEKCGLEVSFGGEELLADFYAPFARNMRDLGVPVWSAAFYAGILAAFPGEAQIAIVRENGAPIGGGLFVHAGETVLVPCASSLRTHFDRCPNHALYWALIRRAIARGARLFDFGRSTPGSGTWRFKRSWGCDEVPCRWHRPIETGERAGSWSTSNPKLRLFVAAWRRLPVGLTRLVGPEIVRRLP